MEPEISLPHSQVAATCPCPEPADPVHTPTPIYLNIVLPSTPGSPKCSLSLTFPHQTPVYTSFLTHNSTWAERLLCQQVCWTLYSYWRIFRIHQSWKPRIVERDISHACPIHACYHGDEQDMTRRCMFSIAVCQENSNMAATPCRRMLIGFHTETKVLPVVDI